ncbi:hypothetical protein EJB00_02365 [Wolbachia endosymbiont of Drosophila mauritiana]|nr:hypothetical protein EJA99_02370 [Wolbachia endosymbiont of Drosophila mauritiana]QCB63528.1 hypothetical protein EJB00_02365 [Wolbachia endosymbiont of Drosophila mauritiana]TGB06865.1 hypothetical protein E5C28_02440 [Wolbachia endosymbiont of Drosophila mauritiana]
MSSQCSDTGIHFSIIRNVDYFYTRKFNWIPVSEHWDDKKRSTGMIRRTFHHVIPAHDQIFLFDPRLADYASSNFNNIYI